MTFEQTIDVNKNIMALIKSKYPEDFPGTYNTPEAHYYEPLDKDNKEAERFLSHSLTK